MSNIITPKEYCRKYINFFKEFNVVFMSLAWKESNKCKENGERFTAKKWTEYLMNSHYIEQAGRISKKHYDKFAKKGGKALEKELFNEIAITINYHTFLGVQREKRVWAYLFQEVGITKAWFPKDSDIERIEKLGVDLFAKKYQYNYIIQVKPLETFINSTDEEKNKIFDKLNKAKKILEFDAKSRVYGVSKEWKVYKFSDQREQKEEELAKLNIDNSILEKKQKSNKKTQWEELDGDK